MIGKSLGRYEIISLLGKGGMGEVYRARDTSLDREVAVKVLPAAFAADAERLARFEREATTLARLQHSNIATIYGFEQDQDRRFLVMELVEGEDLAERLRRGPVATEEALSFAAQIAEGLEAAHVLGIVHRDLKPANVKITPTGDVKLLDFGLARAYAGETASGTLESENSPTITAAMTRAGVILGTAAYMSPEQARGKSVDRQTDIWSFAVVLYEMLTADRLFGGETVSDSIGAILHRDPDLGRLPAVPAQIPTLLRRCLARDKRQRLRDIGDARLELEDAIAARASLPKQGRRRFGRMPWLAAGGLAALVVALGWLAFAPGGAPGPALTTLGLPREEAIDLGIHNAWPRLGFSADGREVFYIGGEEFTLYRRSVDSFDSEPIPGTAAVSLFTCSPDGRWIAYTDGAKLWKVALSGGAPIALCDTESGPGLAWGQGEIYLSRGNGGGIWSVPDSGGRPRVVSQLNDEREETSHRWPHVLPGGRHLLITIKTARIASFDDALIALLSLDTGEVSVLIQGGMFPQYEATGHIVYGRDRQLFAVPFDLAALAVTGTPTRVLEAVDTVDVNGCAQYCLSRGGDLAYLTAGEDQAELDMVWLDVSGKVSRLDIEHPYSFELALSPDGRQLASLVPAANDKIFVYDFPRMTMTRLTNTPGNDAQPVWSPDGTRIAYRNDRDGSADLYVIPADGSAPAQRILASPEGEYPQAWSPDGTRILFTRVDERNNPEIWIMPVGGDGEAQPLFDSGYRCWDPALSPDGRWVAYGSDTSGDENVYIRPFGRAGSPVRVSITDGYGPCWSPDGRTVYYRTGRLMMAAPVEAGASLRVGTPREVFEMDRTVFGTLPLSPDGQRFLANRANPHLRKHFGIRVVFAWTERLRQVRS